MELSSRGTLFAWNSGNESRGTQLARGFASVGTSRLRLESFWLVSRVPSEQSSTRREFHSKLYILLISCTVYFKSRPRSGHPAYSLITNDGIIAGYTLHHHDRNCTFRPLFLTLFFREWVPPPKARMVATEDKFWYGLPGISVFSAGSYL